MFIVDMHCDSLSAVNSERGLVGKHNFSRRYPQLQFVAEFVPKRGMPPEMRRKELMHYLDMFIAEYQRLKLVDVRTCHDLNFAIECEKNAVILAVEGGGGLFADSEELNTLYRMGLRVLGLAWDSNELAASCYEENDYGLTPEGAEMVRRCSELGIIMDVSHLSDRAFYQLTEQTAYPVIATHSNFREVCNHPRNLTRDMAEKIVSRGGIIGLNLYPELLSGEKSATKDDLFRHVDYALERFGAQSLAFGFDIDGTHGVYMDGVNESSSIHDRVIDMLLSRYDEDVVSRIAGENAIEFLKNNI